MGQAWWGESQDKPGFDINADNRETPWFIRKANSG